MNVNIKFPNTTKEMMDNTVQEMTNLLYEKYEKPVDELKNKLHQYEVYSDNIGYISGFLIGFGACIIPAITGFILLVFKPDNISTATLGIILTIMLLAIIVGFILLKIKSNYSNLLTQIYKNWNDLVDKYSVYIKKYNLPVKEQYISLYTTNDVVFNLLMSIKCCEEFTVKFEDNKIYITALKDNIPYKTIEIDTPPYEDFSTLIAGIHSEKCLDFTYLDAWYNEMTEDMKKI